MNDSPAETKQPASDPAATSDLAAPAPPRKPEILFISGSPRRQASAAMVGLLEQGAQAAGATTMHFLLCEKKINPCIGCGACDKTGVCTFAGRVQDGKPVDDYLELKEMLDRADAVGIVAPLYFAGPTAQFKALLDRFQPYYVQRYLLGQPARPKRPAHLYILGSGGDPHGFAPLVGTSRSAFNVAGFTIEKVHDYIGYLSPQDNAALQAELAREITRTPELMRLRRAAARQEDFEQRAVSAGGAFARYVTKQLEANQLSAQLEELKAELEELKTDDDQAAPRRAEATPYDSRDFLDLQYSNLIMRGRGSAEDAAEGSTAAPDAPEAPASPQPPADEA